MTEEDETLLHSSGRIANWKAERQKLMQEKTTAYNLNMIKVLNRLIKNEMAGKAEYRKLTRKDLT